MLTEVASMCEVIRQTWPDGRTLVAELKYSLDEQGRVLSNLLAEHQRAALQTLVDYRASVNREVHWNHFSEATPRECLLYDNLSQAFLTPKQRTEYTALGLVRTMHAPISLSSNFAFDLEIQEDGCGLVEVTETGPNRTTLHTLYVLVMSPQVEIVQAFSSCGEHSSNHQFQQKDWYPDERESSVDVLGQIWRRWH